MARTRPPPCYTVFFVILCLPADNNLGDSDLQTTIVEPYKRALHTFKRPLPRPSHLLNLLLTANNKGLISLRDDVETRQPVRSHGELTGTVVFTDHLRETIQEFGLQETIDNFPLEERYSAKCLKELAGVLKRISVASKIDTIRVLLNWQKDEKSRANVRVLEGEPEDEPAALGDAPEPVAGPSTGPGPIRTPARTHSRINPYETPGSTVVQQRLRRSSTMPSTPSHYRSLNTMHTLAPVQGIPPFRPIIADDAMPIDDPVFFDAPLTPPPSDPRPRRRLIREFDFNDDDHSENELGGPPAPPPHDDATCPVQPRFVELQERQLESQTRIGALEADNAALVEENDWIMGTMGGIGNLVDMVWKRKKA